MKKIVFLIIFLTSTLAWGDNLSKGIWQADSPIVGDGYAERYVFTDSMFTYWQSQYVWISPVLNIQGAYVIDNDSIKMKPQQIVIYKPKSISYDPICSTECGWSLWFGRDDEYYLADTIAVDSRSVALPFKYSIDSINIDGRMFYRCTL